MIFRDVDLVENSLWRNNRTRHSTKYIQNITWYNKQKNVRFILYKNNPRISINLISSRRYTDNFPVINLECFNRRLKKKNTRPCWDQKRRTGQTQSEKLRERAKT